MNASIEISMYPLTPEYGTPILDFIQRLKAHPDIVIKSNTMSTQLFGDYDKLMALLTKEMKTTFEQDQSTVMVMKILNIDTRWITNTSYSI